MKCILLASTGYHCAAISLNSKSVDNVDAVKVIFVDTRKILSAGIRACISKGRSRRQAVHIKVEFGVMPVLRADGVQSIKVCFVLEETKNYPRNSKNAITAAVKKNHFDTARKFIAI